MSLPVILHLAPCHAKRRSGDPIQGILWLDDDNLQAEITLRGFVECSVSESMHGGSGLKDGVHHHTEGKIKESKRALFDTTSVILRGRNETTFTLGLPESTDGVLFEGVRNPVLPPSTTVVHGDRLRIEWGVEAISGDGQVLAWAAFPFAPTPPDWDYIPFSGVEEGGATTDEGKVLKLTSTVFKVSQGELSASIKLEPPHVFSRTAPALNFGLCLDRVKKSSGFTLKKHPVAHVYGTEVALWMRTTYGTDDVELIDVRRQIIPLQLDVDEKTLNLDLIFDLQSTAGKKIPLTQLCPSFDLPGLVKREYYLAFDVNPAHNSHDTVASIPIFLTSGEIETLVRGVQGHHEGVPIFPES